MEDSILILCRGTSIKKLADVPEVEKVFIVNNFSQELKLGFVKEFLKDKDITHFVNREPFASLSTKEYKNLGISKIQLNVFKDGIKTNRNYSRLSKDSFFDVAPLPEILKKFRNKAGGFPTTGILAIVYAVICLNKKNVYVVGMDFYEKDYYIKPAKGYQKKKGVVMKEYLTNFLSKENEGITFHFYTNSSFSPNMENVNIL